MDRIEAFELLTFLEENGYLAGSLTAKQLIEVVAQEGEFEQRNSLGTVEGEKE